MLDRESTFADESVIKLLQTRFIPVAIDQAYQRRQQDTEGEFYRQIAAESPRGDGSNGQTTQGLYIASPAGEFLGFSNHRDPQRILALMQAGLDQYQPRKTEGIEAKKLDPRFNPQPPAGGLIVRVHAKVLDGYPPTDNRWKEIFQTAISRDNLWITEAEHRQLVRGTVPVALQKRIARFHLVDNTRGEPPMWRDQEIRELKMRIEGDRIHGSARLETDDQSRGYDVKLYGVIKVDNEQVKRLDIVAQGDFWGEGPFTRNAPPGKFPLAVTFRLADGSDVADAIPPQGSRGWLPGYLETDR